MHKNIAAVILAAGEGKRMNSAHPKVCLEVLRKPMLSWVVDACIRFGVAPGRICAVLSKQGQKAAKLLPEGAHIAVQTERRGTGHAVMSALEPIKNWKDCGVAELCILCGDVPLVDERVLASALESHRSSKNLVTVLSAVLPDGAGYGRIIRQNGEATAIVEAADASAEQLEISEINSGIYWMDTKFLIDALPLLTDQNAQGEIYLTDLIGLAKNLGGRAGAFVCPDYESMRGANTREELAALNEIARRRVFKRLYEAGVDIPVTDGVLIGPDVKIGNDTLILAGVQLTGHAAIGPNCIVGPFTTVSDSQIEEGCQIENSRIVQSHIGAGQKIGPYANIVKERVNH